jgi:hypothetical protein
VLPGATIIAQQAGTGQKFSAVSNSSGEYLFAQLPVGVYSLSVSAASFKQSALPRIDVHASDRLRCDFMLEIGDRTEVVTVEADTGSVQPESAEIRDIVGRQQVIDLPVKGRQFLDLAMLSAGVVRPPGGTRGDAMQQAGNLVNVLGQRSGHNLYLMDGVAITDEHFNNIVIAPSIDAIEEFNIEKTSYAPEFGGKSGAVINVISRSGANSFHGSLFEFFRSDLFDAKNFFDSAAVPIPPFRQNQFGGSLGGPVRKNKTFFFLSYEGQRVHKSLTQTFSVPTAAMRKGGFSDLPTIYDPTTSTNGQCQPFPNNQIPGGLDPVAVTLLSRYLSLTCLELRRTSSRRETSAPVVTNTAPVSTISSQERTPRTRERHFSMPGKPIRSDLGIAGELSAWLRPLPEYAGDQWSRGLDARIQRECAERIAVRVAHSCRRTDQPQRWKRLCRANWTARCDKECAGCRISTGLLRRPVHDHGGPSLVHVSKQPRFGVLRQRDLA